MFLNTLYEKAFNERTVVHEMLHAAGFNHEQTRSDRDNYVRILWKNIEGDNAHNFEKEDSRTYGEYDVESIMHYYSTSFGKDCHISDYANNHFCKNCEIQHEVDFIAAQGNNKSCSKHTIISKTAAYISPSNSLTQKDIDAINAAYPLTVIPDTVYKLPSIRQSRTLSLTIKELTRVAGTKGESGAFCGQYPDFIGEIVAGDVAEVDTGNKKPGLLLINDVKLSKTKAKDKKVGDSVTPNWKINVPVGPDVKELFVIVKIWEYDDVACGGKNDLIDVSPQNDQAYLRLLVDLTSGEIQHVRPQPASATGGLVYYQRARQSGYSFFDSAKGEFQTVTFSGLEDGDATSYQMEAQIKLDGIIR